MKRILIVGAGGQIGSELTTYLRKIYGNDNVVATDVRECKQLAESGPFEVMNALDANAMAEMVSRQKIDSIFNLVALLSAVGEAKPQTAWQVNIGALMNSLEVARQYNCALFTPSSIGAFGPSSPKDKTPQDTVMRPTTMYGVCKVTGEMLGDYYHSRFGVDTRSVRFPGLISNVTLPAAVRPTTPWRSTTKRSVRPLHLPRAGRCLYGHDVHARCAACLRGADGGRSDEARTPQQFQHRVDELHAGDHLCRDQEASARLHDGLRRRSGEESHCRKLPNSLDDTCAREEWGWKPEWDLSSMTDDMLEVIRKKNLK